MKTRKYLLFASLAALMGVAVQCSDSDPEPGGSTGKGALTAPSLELSTGEIVLSPDKAEDTALTLTWSAATDIGKAKIDYKVYINTADSDMYTDPAVFDAGQELSLELSHGLLNDAIVKVLDLPYGEPAGLKITVYATHVNGEMESAQSNLAELTITPYEPPAPGFPDALYLLGDAMEWRWNWIEGESIPLEQVSEGVYEADGLKLNFGDNNDCGFKMLTAPGVWSPYYAMDAASTYDNIIVIFCEDTEDPQVYPASLGYTNGTYSIRVDLNTMRMTLTPSLEGAFSINGDATEVTWDGRIILYPVADNIWEAEEVFLNCDHDWRGFKIYSHPEWGWDPWYGQDLDPSASFGDVAVYNTHDLTPDPQFYPGAAGYHTGRYTIRLDLNTMKMTLTPSAEGAFSINGAATAVGWDGREILYRIGENIWEAKGVYLDCSEDWHGFKIYSAVVDGWSPWYGQDLDASASFGDVVEYHSHDLTPDPQFFPKLAGYQTGYYTLNLDLNTMKMTLTRED